MDMKEIRKLSVVSIKERVVDIRRAIFNINCQRKMDAQSEAAKRLKFLRKDIARLKTELSSRRLARS
ncbi:50S ribosomal protein L29 [Candidatus Hydrogenosomobacter endosymbioticus]|uniref:Large ribosomal subunit protein uL29 n=1 Tax=Candidatus Hydrogenosomobacter endosymbioticus TaxID=2558174 RepID=A0ABN6L2A7_9PROT|nr:50S ribosomal protein L29 [Candidatus Hydrogenosomobacter endosymbioticus]BDB95948.1 hypothetical protein HYD_0810 [Candidatus Hydrogenosomobacter endosymbioticus]